MIRLGYMTNAFGALVGMGGGVTCMKDVGYLTMGDNAALIGKVASKGYRYFEIFEGNILPYEQNPDDFLAICKQHNAELLGVYVGCHFIYRDALEDELFKVNRVSALAKLLGARHIVLGGGAIRGSGVREGDYQLLAQGIDKAAAIVKNYGLIPSYHPHLGSLAEKPEQIHKLFALTDVAFCPDIAHLAAGGADALELVKTYHARISYIHLKDLSEKGEFMPLGKGALDIAGIIDFLKEQNYQGDWLVEADGYPGDPDEACETSYAFLKGRLI